MQYVYAEATTGALLKVRECVANATDTGCEPAKGQTYWEVQDVNATGAVLEAQLGNGLSTTYSYDLAKGVLNSIDTSGSVGVVQNLTYGWDDYGNLTSRTDHAFAPADNDTFTQTFTYDTLNRLKHAHTAYNIAGLTDDNRYTHYAKNGNISCFNTASSSCTTANYTYHAGKVHAVASKTGTGGGIGAYTYNANGSMESGPDREIAWTAFNKPALICKGVIDDITGVCDTATWSQFKYDPNRARYAQVTATSTTYYVGALYERVEEGATTTHRFHIFAGGSAVAVYSCTTSCGSDPGGVVADGTKDETFYFHKDHLGSINVITDGHGMEQERFTYSAWGEQQRWDATANGGAGDHVPASSVIQKRGYTGHEMMAEFGLIHMNGRIYDQNIGRFISADPFVQFPESTQGYNRYTYVGNNPLSYTDPSGYFSLKKELGNALGHIAGYLSFIPGCQLWCSALAGAVSGYLLTGSLKGAVLGGLSGLASGAMAQWADTGAFGEGLSGWATGAATAGAISGALSAAGGGRFGDGFLSGFAGGTAGALSGGNPIAAAILGGTVSKIGGGKFASGAKSGFFHAMFGESLKQGFSGTSGISSTTGSDATDAKLAMGVYEPEFTGADGYELVERFADGKNGLNAALFANGNDRVLVFAGTDPGSWANWKANFAQAFGFKSAQYEMGIKLATDLQAAYGNIRFTGHSLGGGIASAAAIITGGSATTFNAAGVHDNTLRGFARSNGSIRAYYSAFDMLRFGNAFTPASVAGQQISLGVAGLHGMDGVCQVAGC